MKKASKLRVVKPARNGARPALSQEEVAEFRRRVEVLQLAQMQLRMLQEASMVFAKQLQQKYNLPDGFKVNQTTGEVIVPERKTPRAR